MKKVIVSLLLLLVVGEARAQSNLSTRAYLTQNERVLIAGCIVTNTDNNILVIRALGPTLSGFFVQGPLLDPMIELHDSNGDLLAIQDSYLENNAEDMAFLQEKGLIPSDQRECAIVWRSVVVGKYTTVVRGKAFTEGVALVEYYFYKQ